MSSNVTPKYEIVGEEETKELNKYYSQLSKYRFVRVGAKKWFFPYNYTKYAAELYNFEARPDDTWVVTYPRSGTTLTLELVWLVANDMNFEEAKRRNLHERFPFIEYGMLVNDDDSKAVAAKGSVDYVKQLPSPRFVKTHLPLELIPRVSDSGCKIIYVARNPKDMVVSWYIFQKNHPANQFKGEFEDFCDCFMRNTVTWSPYWEHVKTAWARRNDANFLFIFYEQLRRELPRTIKKVCEFMNKSYSDEEMAKLVDHLGIDNFRENSMVNSSSPVSFAAQQVNVFIRQGKVGGWKEHFTPELEARFDEWIEHNLKDTDLVFPVLSTNERTES